MCLSAGEGRVRGIKRTRYVIAKLETLRIPSRQKKEKKSITKETKNSSGIKIKILNIQKKEEKKGVKQQEAKEKRDKGKK